MLDEDGEWPKWLKNVAKVALGIVATTAAVAIVGVTSSVALPLIGCVAASTVGGAVAGYITSGTNGALNGAVNGFMIGGVATLAVTASTVIVPMVVESIKSVQNDPVKIALQELDKTGLRPGQTEISRSRVMSIVNEFNPSKAHSAIYSNGAGRYLVEGHHTTVASTILGKGSCGSMGSLTTMEPSAFNVYWARRWYQIGRTVIKIKK